MVNINKPPKGIDPVTYDYLYQLSELLGVMLDNGGVNPVQTVQPQQPTASAPSADFSELRSLIIKTADQVTKTREELGGLSEDVEGVEERVELVDDDIASVNNRITDLDAGYKETYVAVSDYGTFKSDTEQRLKANSDGIAQNLSYYSDLTTAITDSEKDISDLQQQQTELAAYIKQGIIGRDENRNPEFGIAIGKNIEVNTNGEIVKNSFCATFTSERLAFWQGNTLVAYITGEQLRVSDVVALRELQVEDWSIKTDNGLSFKYVGG